MINPDGREMSEAYYAQQARSGLRWLWRRRSDLFVPAILCCGLVLLVALLGGGSLEEAIREPSRPPDPPIEPGDFPNLGYQVRSHWIEGKALYYIKDESIAVRDIAERYIRFGKYEVNSLIAKGNEIALTAKTTESFWDRFRGRIRFTYDMDVYDGIRFAYEQENDVYNGIVCRIDMATCKVVVSGNYLIRDFQPYAAGYVFSRTEWEDFSLGADFPTDVISSVVVVMPGWTASGDRYGGIQSLFIGENGSFVDIRNASDLTFPRAEGVYRWSGGPLQKIELKGLEPERHRYGGSGQLRTNGFHWAISYYNVENGRISGVESEYFCQNRLSTVESKSAVFLAGRSMSYIDNNEKLVLLDCDKALVTAPVDH